jgi:hypothetical protein
MSVETYVDCPFENDAVSGTPAPGAGKWSYVFVFSRFCTPSRNSTFFVSGVVNVASTCANGGWK